ncbi:mucin-2 isoform X2 [Engraulis encrasicolus]|uniref:mucin-2 isoform X2 n=1 Tax=Engraulis encrasicolus TaxID=184585 RepID=UPI002FD1EC9D
MFPRTTDFGTVIVFFTSILSGVHSADVVPALLLALRDSTAAVSSFPTHLNISIRITNRVYNDTLGDPNSPDHKRLRKEVRLLLNSALEGESNYGGITDMAFSNGSVIANTTVQFGRREVDPVKVKHFVNIAKTSMLELQKDFTKVIQSSPPELREKKDSRSSDNQTVELDVRAPTTSDPPTTSVPDAHTPPHSPSDSTGYSNPISPLSTPPGHLSQVTSTTDHSLVPPIPLPPFDGNGTNPHTTTTKTASHASTTTTTSHASTTTTSHASTTTTSHAPPTTTTSPDSTTTTTSHGSPMTTTAHGSSMTTTAHGSPMTTTSHASTMTTSHVTTHSPNITSPHPTNMTATPHSNTTTTYRPNISTPHPFNVTTTSHLNNMTTPHSDNMTTPHSDNMTTPHSDNITTTHHTSNVTTTPDSDNMTTPHSGNMTTPHLNNMTTPHSDNMTTSHPSIMTSRPQSSSVSSPHSSSSAAPVSSEGTPGWGIALLVLAALILLLVLIFLVYLMYYCCCRRPEPTPYMAFNPDIPMYSTQSTIDLPNGKAYGR